MSKKVKVGIFLVGGIVLFCVGLFLIGSRQQLFTHHFVVYTEFNNIDTLQTGHGTRVGNGCG
jgi:phospholipid/cholesterol/gamma-HCH transport system substrate-binding protein